MQTRVLWMIAAALCAVAAYGDGPVTANWLPTAAGEYPILTATALGGGLDGWTKAITNESRFSAALVTRGNALCLRLLPRGTVLLLR